ncbi:NRAMP family divalent metal transporter [Thermaurantiacus sp.]
MTGAADDDPSGIATYSQAGAQFGLNMLWTIVFTFPLMTSVQAICARIGRVTGQGLAVSLDKLLPRGGTTLMIGLLFVANTINIGADLAAMGAAVELLVGSGRFAFAMLFALVSLLLQMFVPYRRYVVYLKWLTLALFAYVGVIFTVEIDWSEVWRRTLMPELPRSRDALIIILAVFGTTISPYLFFWQASEEVEDAQLKNEQPSLLADDSAHGRREIRRIRIDTIAGMGFSNLVAFFIMLTTAVTLHEAGITRIASAAEAAEALRPVAGPLAFLLFTLGIIGTGMLALPVLAGSTAYALCEVRGWSIGLEKKPSTARAFYGVIMLGMGIGVGILWLPLDPIKALVWSAVINGIVAVPLLAATMLVASSQRHLGVYVAPRWELTLGWATTLAMAATAVSLLFV